jgi:ADP-heptose:LPS heptosyltransferase
VDEADGNALQNEFPYKVFNACGKMNLQQSASLIRQAKLVITPDTGMMHIAAAFQKRIISIWGNTTPALGMAPYFSSEYSAIETDSARIENKELDCRPCSKIGYQQCPKKHFRCMNDLDEKIIANAVKGLNNNLPVIA